ncbi:hypothetical protein ACHWQZ_G013053 [Mnemiopsis leidyi]
MNKDELRTADKQPQKTPMVVVQTPERAPDNTQKPDRTPDNASKPVDVPLRRSERLRNKENVMNKDELRTADKQPQKTPMVVVQTPERAPDNTQKPDRTPDNASKPVDVPLRRSERLRNKESNF